MGGVVVNKMGETVVHKTRDRVSVEYSRTINIGNFESVRVHAGYSTDLRKEESVEEAFTRAEAESARQLEAFCEPIERQTAHKKTKGKAR